MRFIPMTLALVLFASQARAEPEVCSWQTQLRLAQQLAGPCLESFRQISLGCHFEIMRRGATNAELSEECEWQVIGFQNSCDHAWTRAEELRRIAGQICG
jgi:hypothetical protein